MGSLSIWHWGIVLVVVLLIFGTKKLRGVGKDLGGAVADFKDGLKGGENAVKGDAAAPPSPAPTNVIEGEVKRDKV